MHWVSIHNATRDFVVSDHKMSTGALYTFPKETPSSGPTSATHTNRPSYLSRMLPPQRTHDTIKSDHSEAFLNLNRKPPLIWMTIVYPGQILSIAFLEVPPFGLFNPMLTSGLFLHGGDT